MKLGYYIIAAALAMSSSAFGLIQWIGLGQVGIPPNKQICITEYVQRDSSHQIAIGAYVQDTFPICDSRDPNCNAILAIDVWHNGTRYSHKTSFRKPGEKAFPYLDGGIPNLYELDGEWKVCYKVSTTPSIPIGSLSFYASDKTPSS